MTLKKGDLWKSNAKLKLFTGNSSIRRDGCLVMGKGAALEAQRMFPNCNRTFGALIAAHYKTAKSPYGVILHPDIPIGVFQVKEFYGDPAVLHIIEYSTQILADIASIYKAKGNKIAMNFPGIGWGGLNRLEVLPVISSLPDNVEIWEYDNRR